VAISGNTILVSSAHSHKDPLNGGSIYVYVEPAGGWSNMTETAELSFQQKGAGIGEVIATNGNIVVSFNSYTDSAVVWTEPSGGWVTSVMPNAELINSEDQPMGSSVAISGNVIVVGAPGAYSNYGATYLYEKPAKGWNKIGITETARLVGDAIDAGGGGNVVAISGDTVTTTANGLGVYVFEKPSAGWADMNQNAFLVPYTGADDASSLGFDGSTIVVGIPLQIVGVNPQQGAAFVFEKPAGGWKNTSTASAEVVASDGNINDQFGTAVDVSGGTIVAGSPLAQIGANLDEGAAYVFAQQ